MVYIQWGKDKQGKPIKPVVWPEAGATAYRSSARRVRITGRGKGNPALIHNFRQVSLDKSSTNNYKGLSLECLFWFSFTSLAAG
jgi:hypothetical protein